MKEWVIGNPYTTETLLTPSDDHLILACDGVWDVCSDQCAVELVKKSSGGNNPQKAAQTLLEYSLENLSTDNLSILVVKLNPSFCSLVTGV